MFGYVRPNLDALGERELELYRAAYCGLCHTLGKKYGFLARLTLNYDFTLLAMLFSLPEREPGCCMKRCPVHPFRGKTLCACGAGMELAADQSMILFWQKLRDDGMDKGPLGGLPARLAARALNGAYRKAATAQPGFDKQVEECLEQLRALEEARCPSIDRTADAFARLLSAAPPPDVEPGQFRALKELLYHLGRWVYLADAWDDLEEDRKSGNYNPLEERFHGAPEEEIEYVRTTMTHSLRLAASAFQLAEFGGWGPVIEKILYAGLPSAQSVILAGRWREASRGMGPKRTRGRASPP